MEAGVLLRFQIAVRLHNTTQPGLPVEYKQLNRLQKETTHCTSFTVSVYTQRHVGPAGFLQLCCVSSSSKVAHTPCLFLIASRSLCNQTASFVCYEKWVEGHLKSDCNIKSPRGFKSLYYIIIIIITSLIESLCYQSSESAVGNVITFAIGNSDFQKYTYPLM